LLLAQQATAPATKVRILEFKKLFRAFSGDARFFSERGRQALVRSYREQAPWQASTSTTGSVLFDTATIAQIT
jgi:hypothetical protein